MKDFFIDFDYDFYSIEEDANGVKNIHILGNICYDDGRYITTEYVGFIEPLSDFIAHIKDNMDYVNEKAETLNQCGADVDATIALGMVAHYFDGKAADYFLDYTDITIDTPIGNYCAEF